MAALVFSVVVAVGVRLGMLAAALGVGLAVAAVARLRPADLARRLIEVNLFILLLWVFLPFTYPGEALAAIGPLTATREGVTFAGAVTLKANAIVLVSTALVATVDLARLGHALYHLRLPATLIHLFTFMVRYFDVLHREYVRLRNAMRVRGFRPRTNRHTYRTYAYLVGMLLVRSFDRSHRVMAAMKCRGFRGQFYVLSHFTAARRDFVFGLAWFVVVAALGAMEWMMVRR